MKLPLSWIREWIALDQSTKEIANALTLAGLEVDGVEEAMPSFSGVVAGLVQEAKPHPEADGLRIAKVFDGQEEYEVVCGASNCRAGIHVAFARVGAKIDLDSEKPLKIKKSKLRGVTSHGMLCSQQELGMGEDHKGIIELDPSIPLGTDLAEREKEEVLDISLTPNLSHCWSVLGVLRELSAALDVPYTTPASELVEQGRPIDTQLVQIEATKECSRYAARVVLGVKVGPSPSWLQKRLSLSGLRPINNVVDATNYIMLLLGQPLHAFDLAKLQGGVQVRKAKKGEKIKRLDGAESTLDDSVLVIADKGGPVAIAGVMGGEESEVDESTTDLLLESAHFTPETVRRGAKSVKLSTESSKRFERGVDPHLVPKALDALAALILEIAGGEVQRGMLDCISSDFAPKTLLLRLPRIEKILGKHISSSEVTSILRRLELPFHVEGEKIRVTIPSYRFDLSEEIDLIEEIARVYGFAHFLHGKAASLPSPLPHSPIYLFQNEVRELLVAEGLQEFMSADLIGPTILQIIGSEAMNPSTKVEVVNPTSIEQSILRRSLLPGLLQAVQHNVDHGVRNIAGFEIGRIHFREEKQYREQSMAGIVLVGATHPHSWKEKRREVDFFDLKGVVENFLEDLGLSEITFTADSLPMFHPGRQASVMVKGEDVGILGEVHAEVQHRLDVDQRIYFAELNLHALFRLRDAPAKFRPLPLYPEVTRDWTVSTSSALPAAELRAAAMENSPDILRKVDIHDVYEGEGVAEDARNITLRFTYRDEKKTLRQEKVDRTHQQIIETISKKMKTGTA